MGWDFTQSATKQDVINNLVKDYSIRPEQDWDNRNQCFVPTGFDVEQKTLDYKVIGNTLWTVFEIIKYKGKKEFSRKRYICCNLLEQGGIGWGYKAMGEAAGPFYYDCPLEFLDMVSVVDEEWRKKVRRYHQKFV